MRRVPETREQVLELLRSYDFRPARRFGQSFLVDPFVADAEAALVEAASNAPIVEVGGGLGQLTAALLRRGFERVRVIERDRRLARFLRSAFESRIEVEESDALRAQYEGAHAVVGNLPFSIATPLLLRLFEARVPRIVVLVQEEVAARLLAAPGSKEYGRLSIVATLYGEAQGFARVPASAFEPVPAVDARILAISGRPGPLPVRSPERLTEIVRILFSGRRKQLGNLVPRLAPGRRARVEVWIEAAAWPSDWRRRRPEDLAPEAYFRLANAVDE